MKLETPSFPNANFKIYLGSTLFFIYIFSSMPVFSILIILCSVFPFSVRYELSKIWVNSVLWVAKICCGIDYEIEGLENLPKDRPVIVLSKHQSAWETIALRQFLPPQTLLLKKSLLSIPFGGWALATLKPIAIDRTNQRQALKTLIDDGTKALQEGLWVVVFPEGTRTAPKKHHKFSAGGAMLAQKSATAVIPLAHNAGQVWPRYSFLKYPGTIKIKIGALIEVEGKKARDINAEAERWVINAMSELET
ncbi:MAG: 1-acyl-sn-glycerol-3-phosphate acyltransferase [Methylococcales bacterium]|nr:1-acyl-sn-glycerol-3-phosphate acyltransferase [Methylococcales bacterium]